MPSERDGGDVACAVDMALNDVAAERIAGAKRRFQVHAAARLERAEAREAERLVHHVRVEGAVFQVGDGQADAVDRDGIASRELARDAGLDLEPRALVRELDPRDRPKLFHDAGKHALTTPSCGP